MANKPSKGRQNKAVVKKGISPSGPKQGFARPAITKTKTIIKSVEKKISQSVPLNVCVVPFHESVFNESLIEFVSGLIVTDSDQSRGVQIRTGHILNHPKRAVQVVVPNHRSDMTLILDAAKTADVLLCVFPSEATFDQSCFDELGYQTLSALRLQGLPPLVVGVPLFGPMSTPSKLGIKTVHRYFVSEFSNDKAARFVTPNLDRVDSVCEVATQVAAAIAAATCGGREDTLALRRNRGYMLIDNSSIDNNTLVVSGFARGTGFGPKSIVHITGSSEHVWLVKRMDMMDGESFDQTEDELASMRTETEALRQAEMQEQTWPTAEEEAEQDRMMNIRMRKVMVPVGAESEIEAAWLGEEIEDNEDDELLQGMFDWDKLGDVHIEGDKPTLLEPRTREEMDFPDEVDTPETSSARIRFQKYRGLKSSLRSGDWDPYEELPVEYSQIHEFQDIAWASKQCVDYMRTTGQAGKGKYVRIILVPQSGSDVTSLIGTSVPLVASTMGMFESKVTVMHCRVGRLADTAHLAIANKQLVLVQSGFCRMTVRPSFSEIPKHGSAALQRMYRTVPAYCGGNSVLMSYYGPAIFGSCSTLVWVEDRECTESLVMWGSVVGSGPNKPIIVKRATLTGYPFRVHKTKAVCRFMFFDPADIDWFRPVELSTKKGLRGHIMESLGTHGYMKCRFNGQLTSDDVICMHLYKRVFPKWTL